MSSLQEWNESFGDMNLFPEKSGSGFDWKMGMAYPCKITSAKIILSSRGDKQIELNIDVQGSEDPDANTIGKDRQWIDLPKQESDKGKDRQMVEKMTVRRVENLMRLYSAAMPGEYALYKAKVVGPEGKAAYKDFDDNIMSNDAFTARKVQIQTELLKRVGELHESVDQEIEILADTLLYISKAENPKNEKYPYTNYYATRPYKTPVYNEGMDQG